MDDLPKSNWSLEVMICSSKNLASKSCMISHNTVPIVLSNPCDGVMNDHFVPLNSKIKRSCDLPPPVLHCNKLVVAWLLAGVNVLLSNNTILSSPIPSNRVALRFVFPLSNSLTWKTLHPYAGRRLHVWMYNFLSCCSLSYIGLWKSLRFCS